MRLFSLGARLCAAAELIHDGACVIDVGSDHARLPVRLLSDGRIKKAYAADISPCSVEKARQAALKYNLSDRLLPRLSDGLDGFSPSDADTVVLAGLGGDVISSILKKAPWVADGQHFLIIQCMSSLDVLNDLLAANRYSCLDEKIVRENGRIYSVAKLCGTTARHDGTDAAGAQMPIYGSAAQASSSDDFSEFVLPSQFGCASPLFTEYINKLKGSVIKAQNGMKLGGIRDARQEQKLARQLEYYNYLIQTAGI